MYLALIRVGVPRGTEIGYIWETVMGQTALKDLQGAKLYRPTRGFYEPTEWVIAGDLPEPLGTLSLPGDTLPLRKAETYPFQNEVNPYNQQLLGSSMPVQLVTITVMPPRIDEFEKWYSEHADFLSRAPGATGARRYWQPGEPRRYASLYYYSSEAGIETYYTSNERAEAAQSRVGFDPWLVDQHHAYYEDITPDGA